MKAFQANIIKRFLGDKEYKTFQDEYFENRLRFHRSRAMTQKDKIILIEYKKGTPIADLCRKHKMTRAAILTCIAIAIKG